MILAPATVAAAGDCVSTEETVDVVVSCVETDPVTEAALAETGPLFVVSPSEDNPSDEEEELRRRP